MSDMELRFECLRLASQQGLPDIAAVIAAAQKLYAFATGKEQLRAVS
jgi:hypothetical protein